MSVSFDKKLAELDAYLQMLISENESLDKKLTDYTRSSNATINSYEGEIENIVNIKNNLERLLSSIKHAIVLLQIAKVSARSSSVSSFGGSAADLRSSSSNVPQPPTRPTRSSKLTSSSSSSSSKDSTKSSACARTSSGSISSSTTNNNKNKSAIDCGRRIINIDNNLQQQQQQQRQEKQHSQLEQQLQRQQPPSATITAGAATSAKLQQDHILSHHHHHHQTPSSLSPPLHSELGGTEAAPRSGAHVGGLAVSSSPFSISNNDNVAVNLSGEIEEEDDAFFDAADETQQQQPQPQQSHSKSITNISSSSIKLLDTSSSHPDTTPSPLISAPPQPTTTTTTIRATATSNINNNNNYTNYSTTNLDSRGESTATSGNIDIMSETNNNVDSTIGDVSIDWDAMYEEENEEELGSLEGQGSVLKHLLSQIRIGMDLTKVVLPTFILERRSLLEMYADFFAHPDLFSTIPDFPTPEARMIQLVRWYLSAFHAGRKSSIAKKPYNPILGEIFKCQWSWPSHPGDSVKHNNTSNNDKNNKQQQQQGELAIDDNNGHDKQQNKLTFVAEQVSHHPPVSAFYAENKEKSISCCAHIYTKSRYLGLSVGVHNIGKGVITLSKHNETYTCTFPSAYGRSILTVPWMELGDPVTIVCEETGYKANIEFVTRPFYGGKKHRVTGEILRPNNEPILTIDGEWNGIMNCKSPPHSSEKKVFVDTTNLPVIKKHVNPVSTQESFESRNVWKEVTRALKMRDVNSATAAKSYIEQRQRDLLRDRQEEGVKWKTRYFEASSNDSWTYSFDGKQTD